MVVDRAAPTRPKLLINKNPDITEIGTKQSEIYTANLWLPVAIATVVRIEKKAVNTDPIISTFRGIPAR